MKILDASVLAIALVAGGASMVGAQMMQHGEHTSLAKEHEAAAKP